MIPSVPVRVEAEHPELLSKLELLQLSCSSLSLFIFILALFPGLPSLSLARSEEKRKSPSCCWFLTVCVAMLGLSLSPSVKIFRFNQPTAQSDNVLITDERCWKHDVKLAVPGTHVVKHRAGRPGPPGTDWQGPTVLSPSFVWQRKLTDQEEHLDGNQWCPVSSHSRSCRQQNKKKIILNIVNISSW